ncbi:hypothetical protein BBAL3_998 [Brevundimonas sp. BAL3]|jgi:hypothetical protein|uniref:Uncharacterized protein n=1 Tax=Brevundimonas mediterranea TaxID=74329 RepID=A0A7Z8Y1K7_9CAUL|nr:hypothetical protein BBAL3_998 [Brevundimonas sp. BAL3]VDC49048.1 hypothetical protein BREV_BREV_00983 [Brevundimonas mediterranea]
MRIEGRWGAARRKRLPAPGLFFERAQVFDADTSPENMALDILPLSPREAGLCGVGVSP